MTRAYVPLLLILAAAWGASFLFIKVALDDVEPAPMMTARCFLAALVLVPFLFVRVGVARGTAELRRAVRPGLVLGVVNAALPFTLIAWGEQHIDSGVAAVANATVPLFTVLLAIRFTPTERVSGARLGGIVVGLVGVAVLAGGQPDAGWWSLAGTLAVVVASFVFAVGALYGQAQAEQTDGTVLVTAAMIAGGLLLLPLGLTQLPPTVPGWDALASIAALALLGAAFGQLLMFRMLRLHGAARVSLVTYLVPAMALVYGAVLLGEPLTTVVLGGLALILAGVALGSGAIRLRR